MNDYLVFALLQHSESIAVNADLTVTTSEHVDFDSITLAAQINLLEWRNEASSRHYVSYIKGKTGKKSQEYFSC